jgi:RNA polymerase sigma factor (sigma-70 family)
MHINILLNYGSKLTSDKELLKDCIHDVFVKLFTKKDELDMINNLKSYLFISLKNRIYDEFRRRVYISDTEIEDATPALEADDTERSFLMREKEELDNLMVERLLVQLSPRQREVLTLYYWDEKNYEDICKIMNMNYQSVRNLMHRSLTKLRSLVNYA